MGKGIEIGSNIIIQVDKSERHPIYEKHWWGNHIIGFYDPQKERVEIASYHSNLLFDVVRVIADKYGCPTANKVWHSLRWIYPSS